jgi:hypothetical protein
LRSSLLVPLDGNGRMVRRLYGVLGGHLGAPFGLGDAPCRPLGELALWVESSEELAKK